MKLELLDVSPSEEARAWELFPKSLFYCVLHNEMVKKILALHDTLETTSPENLIKLQSELKAHRYLLGVIHRKDASLTK